MPVSFRAETVGSLLRPNYLKNARRAWQAGDLAMVDFKRIEDRAVDGAIALQEGIGLDVITDGEMRRQVFIDSLTAAVDGLSAVPASAIHWHGPTPADEMDFQPAISVTGRLRRRRSLATEEFAYARARAHKPLKMTLPSPLMLALLWSPEHSTAAYSDPFKCFADATDILRDEIRELAALGCEYIQIDAPELATLVDDTQRRATYAARGVSPERMLGEGIEMLNALADATGVMFGLHLCRGNNAGHWMSRGGYESISKQVFCRATNYRTFLLEYDDSRSGSFEPLSDIPRDKSVVLGLISTKKSELESPDALVERIVEASSYFPRAQLALSTQCGFASVMQGNPVTADVQERKLCLVSEVARRFW
jgi:5-methyltetrahydropteroyltriglutamate--homocysteine methyltransferase